MISVFEKNDKLQTEWSNKNAELDPTKISYGSTKKVWWICDKGHEWQAPVKNRTKEKPSGCPYCSHRKILKGFNDLKSQYPKIAKEWSTKNAINADEVMSMSNMKVWWKCKAGHEYEMDIPTRTAKSAGCPFCNGVLLKGFNDLGTTHPDIAKEYSEYNKHRIDEIKANSIENVRWRCSSCNHEWMMVVKTRVNGSGCPECSRKLRIEQQLLQDQFRRAKRSFLLQRDKNVLLYYLKKCGVNYIENDDKQIGINLSIYLPDIKTAIELSRPDHESEIGRKREMSKDSLCKKSGIRLIRIVDPGYSSHEGCLAIRKHDLSDEALEQAVAAIMSILGFDIDICLRKELAHMVI